MAHVFVAMSGGVDSSVAAALLVDQGHHVEGVTMRLLPPFESEDGGCCSAATIGDARRVCGVLGIAHHTVDMVDVFDSEVITPFADEYAAGRTPNPCVICNDRIKFGHLLSWAQEQGADALATGHYARVVRDSDGEPWLARGLDVGKDQSYFLYRMTREQLEHVVFPVGGLDKSRVREIAREHGLLIAEKPDSQEICFVADGDHSTVVSERFPEALVPGEIVDATGDVKGRHSGIARYTIGQRKGLGIGGGEAWYVTGIEPGDNRIVVGRRDELSVREVRATDIRWRGDAAEQCDVVIRYRMQAVPARVATRDGELEIVFQEPLLGVAPGQSVVCYRDDRCIGGGVIACVS